MKTPYMLIVYFKQLIILRIVKHLLYGGVST